MTKHLTEFLDSFGNEASAYDAINYCRSRLVDLRSIPVGDLKASLNKNTRIYGRSPLRREFIMSKPSIRARR